MGLDIYFYKVKKSDFDKYQEDLERWDKGLDNWTSSHDVHNLSDEEKSALNGLYNRQPRLPSMWDAYFRKVNFLLGFFDYEENCSNVYFGPGWVTALVDYCERVLKDHSLADVLLPTETGFFFGGTDYDEWYFKDVKQVYDTFKDLTFRDDEGIVMHCWW